jgi:3-deoxy-D-manno-octulosonic-acid transferase
MFSLLYNCILLLLVGISLPKLLWQWCVRGKYRGSLKARLGISLPTFTPKKGQKVIWLHTVSMGETRAIIPLFRQIKQKFPEAAVVISTTTETGQEEAKRSMPDADVHFFLPLDFSWNIRRLMDRIEPTRLILCESDFWYNLLNSAKKLGAHIALVNGKVSERSCRRFRRFRFFTRKLFGNFDTLCVQSEPYRGRFLSMGIDPQKIFVTGNLKLDSPAKKMQEGELQALRNSLHLKTSDRILTIGSTHAPEEEQLLSSLQAVLNKIPDLKVLLVPRHPERFEEVAHLLQQIGIPFGRFSAMPPQETRLILIDTMGKLNSCYQLAETAIVGGSYTTKVGGHNIFEPVVFGVPVIFGPHMHSQPDLKQIVLDAGAGKQVPMEHLAETLIELLENRPVYNSCVDACNILAESIQGSTQRTFSFLFK